MNNITKGLIIFLLISVVAFGITSGYYYFKLKGVQDKQLNDIEQREQTRTVDIDSILKRNETLQDSITAYDSLIKKIRQYEPPKVDNSDLPDANSRELDSILTSYYK